MEKCIFCKIVKKKTPSLTVYEDKFVMAFAPLKETSIGKGHILVIPKKHYQDIYDIPDEYLCKIIIATKKISKSLKIKFKANGINILHASGRVGQQSVFHFHLHLIPRFKNDGLNTWPKTNYKVSDDFESIYREMKKEIIKRH